MNNKIIFPFKGSIFAFKNDSSIEIENQNISANYPKFQFGFLQDGQNHFEIRKENIISMGISFSYIIPLVFGIIAVVLGCIILNGLYYEEEYPIYSAIGWLLAFFGGTYMYDTIIKPKRNIEEIKLSTEFLVRGVALVVATILLFLALFKVGMYSIVNGAILAFGWLLILLSFSVKYRIIDKQWISYSFPVVFWQLGEIKRILRVNFPEFFKNSVKADWYNTNPSSATPYQTKNSSHISDVSEDKNINFMLRKVNKILNNSSMKFLSWGLVATIFAYFFPIIPKESDMTFFNILWELLESIEYEDVSLILSATLPLLFPFILFIIIGGIAIWKWINSKNINYINIFSGTLMLVLTCLMLSPIRYINIIHTKMSSSQIKEYSELVSLGLWSVFLFIAIICLGFYVYKINSKK